MQYKMIPWAPVYSHVAQMSLIQNVASNHLNKFPAGYFKNRWLNDKRSIQNLYKDKKFLNDLKLPAVAVSYEVDDDPKNTLEQGDYPYLYASHYMAGDLGTYYWKLFRNPKTKAEVYMAPVRMKITLTFKYLFPDINTRDDMYLFMLMTFRYAGPPDTYGLYNAVYAAVPQVMLNYIGNAEGYDLTKEDDLKQFNFELMAYSHRRFALKKTDLNRGDKMIFTKYEMPHMQLIQTQKPEKDDGEVKGQTKTNYGITETLEFEPYVPQMFITKLPEVINGRRIPDAYRPISASNQGIDDRLLATRNYHSDPVSKCLHGVKDLTPIADIEFTMGPADDGVQGLQFVDEVKGGIIPREFIQATERGFKGAMSNGVLAGFPIENLKVTLTDGSFHPVDSDALSFESAAHIAFKEAGLKAGAVLMEPVMRVEIHCPDEYLGDVTGDLNKKRSILREVIADIGFQVVKADVPLAEMFGYITQLRSMSSGRANFNMELSHYAPVPEAIADVVIKKAKGLLFI